MFIFIRRFIGALALDASTFEDVEADRLAGIQSAAVVTLACVAAGFAAMNLGAIGIPGFVAGFIAAVSAWIVWAALIAVVGTRLMAGGQTHTSFGELLRVLGFAAAPGVFFVFAAMQTVTPLVFIVVSVWIIAATVVGVRQALDLPGRSSRDPRVVKHV